MKRNLSTIFMVISLVAIILAIYGAFASADVWLASTQWMLVAGVLAIYALFFKE